MDGSVFRIITNGAVNTVFRFNSSDGSSPVGPLVLADDGNLYGVATQGGGTGNGTVFQLSTNGVLDTLFSFSGTNGTLYSGQYLCSLRGLAEGSDGNFYGEAVGGGAGYGTLFQVTPTGSLTTLHFFDNGATNDGQYPVGGLIQASDGNFYGVTAQGGSGTDGGGTVFRLSVPLPPVFQFVAQTNGTLAYTWSAVAGRTYLVQFTTNLMYPNWVNLGGTVTATNGVASACDPSPSDPQRFYRVMLVQ